MINKILSHYETVWQAKARAHQWEFGPMKQLVPEFKILVFAPTEHRKIWTYATCGMSEQPDAPALELHLFSPCETNSLVELLTVVAHYHLTGAYLDLAHVVNFGKPWLPGSRCDHGLISLPYLDGPKLEWFDGEKRIRFLWLIPITEQEAQFAKRFGMEKIETRFEEKRFNYLDPTRPSVV